MINGWTMDKKRLDVLGKSQHFSFWFETSAKAVINAQHYPGGTHVECRWDPAWESLGRERTAFLLGGASYPLSTNSAASKAALCAGDFQSSKCSEGMSWNLNAEQRSVCGILGDYQFQELFQLLQQCDWDHSNLKERKFIQYNYVIIWNVVRKKKKSSLKQIMKTR